MPNSQGIYIHSRSESRNLLFLAVEFYRKLKTTKETLDSIQPVLCFLFHCQGLQFNSRIQNQSKRQVSVLYKLFNEKNNVLHYLKMIQFLQQIWSNFGSWKMEELCFGGKIKSYFQSYLIFKYNQRQKTKTKEQFYDEKIGHLWDFTYMIKENKIIFFWKYLSKICQNVTFPQPYIK